MGNRLSSFPKYLEDAGPGRKLLSLLFYIIGSGLIFTLVGSLAAMLIYGLPASSNPDLLLTSPQGIGYLKIVQVFSSIGIFLIPPVLIAYFSGNDVPAILGIRKFPPISLLFTAMILMLLLLPFINITAEWNNQLVFPEFLKELSQWMRESEDRATEITEGFLNMPDMRSLLGSLIIMAMIPAIAEEFLFRATIQPLLVSLTGRRHLAVWLTAFIFSFIHFQFFGFLPRFLIGAFLGYLMIWSGNTWLPIAAHFANNAIAVTGYYLLQHQFIDQSPDEVGKANLPVMIVISALVAIAGIFYFYRKTRETAKHAKDPAEDRFPR